MVPTATKVNTEVLKCGVIFFSLAERVEDELAEERLQATKVLDLVKLQRQRFLALEAELTKNYFI